LGLCSCLLKRTNYYIKDKYTSGFREELCCTLVLHYYSYRVKVCLFRVSSLGVGQKAHKGCTKILLLEIPILTLSLQIGCKWQEVIINTTWNKASFVTLNWTEVLTFLFSFLWEEEILYSLNKHFYLYLNADFNYDWM
jgi:hypothetical protein